MRDVGPGAPGRILRSALASPHATIALADSGRATLPRDSTYATTVVVFGGDATVGSRVHGDVVVVGGDLFLHPGAQIDGRAVAIGGGVYNSTLAVVRGAILSYRDQTFVADSLATGDTLRLAYRSLAGDDRLPLVSFPAYGLRFPLYDRVDGLSLGFGPYIALDTGRVVIEPTLTYRSQLGVVDPAAQARLPLGRRATIAVSAGRGTFTNDAWIRSDILNSVATFASGLDTRNYYRADRAEARAERLWESETADIAPFVGALIERAWSVGPDAYSEGAPFSIFGRRDRDEGMLRPNPSVAAGSIASAIVGATAHWQAQGGVTAGGGATVELPFHALAEGRRFTQATLDANVGFPTFGLQRLDVFAHAVLTAGDTAPPQRFAYLGGSGTIVTSDLLTFGGDQLLYVESQYTIPLDRPRLPFLGSPTIALRHMIGSAGVGGLPDFVQNVGVRVSLSLVRLDYAIDPATRDSRFGVSLSLFR
ncbi:MAG TPA: hypothetical protein VFJ74_03045 [Gemmatimonadaceae bacterium]|nr:hypothetical protein [Gemmatimonadaceae bacterium]